jgi:transposase InsO family protein
MRRSAQRDLDKLMPMVQPIRKILPRTGGRKLLFMMRDQLDQNRVKIGRDKFFDWLRDRQLLVRPKRRYARTTQSHHRFWTYDNLARGLLLSKPNQLWVSDVTYIRTMEGFCYLALVTDAHSRKIVGFDISDSLELDGCLRALKFALQTASDLSQLTHHSDRGIQYCSRQYVSLLKDNGISIRWHRKATATRTP